MDDQPGRACAECAFGLEGLCLAVGAVWRPYAAAPHFLIHDTICGGSISMQGCSVSIHHSALTFNASLPHSACRHCRTHLCLSPHVATLVPLRGAGNMHSETVGSRGPVLLEDYHLVEKLANLLLTRCLQVEKRMAHLPQASHGCGAGSAL